LIDSRARDAYACLAVLDGRTLEDETARAAKLLAAVVGQDLEEVDGTFRIARRVAKDRIISTVDTDTRHGHKTSARGFDGFKGHVSIDPDSEIITETAVTSGNVGDAAGAAELLDECLTSHPTAPKSDDTGLASTDAARSDDTGMATGQNTESEPMAVYGDAAYGAGELLSRLVLPAPLNSDEWAGIGDAHWGWIRSRAPALVGM